MSISSAEIRETFQRFFEANNHLRIKGASIVPKNDPTLLFINSGMAPLKPYFTGEAKPPQSDLCNVQPCIRTIDIDDVGDRHHLTFFEMLGSWSIDGYFKETAIKLAYDLLVNHFKFDPKRLVASVYKGNPDLNLEPDHESAKIWKSLGFDDDHIVYQDHKDNFWGPAGETGPCGPCTEVFFDTGEDYGPTYKSGGDFDDVTRYIEIWNAGVFMEFNKEKDGSYTPLKFTSVDTGSGLERMTMVLNNHQTVYETDLLAPIITYNTSQIPTISTEHNRILADHCRAFTLMLAEGVSPSNEGRGYIPRRLIRKCLVIIHQNNANYDFDKVFDIIQESLGDAYPHLVDKNDQIRQAFHKEKNDFERVLNEGMKRLEELCQSEKPHMSGNDMFVLVSTYGFPPDLIRDYVRQQNGSIDEEGYQQAFEEHQAISKASKQDDGQITVNLKELENELEALSPTTFTGYDTTVGTAHVTKLLVEKHNTDTAHESDDVLLITNETPFYAESGGQIGDSGTARTATGTLQIQDTQKTAEGVYVHFGNVTSGEIKTDQNIELFVDQDRRDRLAQNHSATHLLQSALRQTLGQDVKQAGSLVEPNRLRFDFNCDQKPTDEQLQEIDRIVNQLIQDQIMLETKECSMDEALNQGAIAFFEDKYGDTVRVVKFGNSSIELCGGTHTSNTKNIKFFKIISEGSVGKGTRRISALTEADAEQYFKEQGQVLNTLSKLLDTPIQQLLEKLASLNKKIDKDALSINISNDDSLKNYLAQNQLIQYLSKQLNTPIQELPTRIEKLLSESQTKQNTTQHIDKATIDANSVDNPKHLCYHHNASLPNLRDEACRIADIINGPVCLTAPQGDKIQIAIAIPKSQTDTLNANKLLQNLAPIIDGRGGGKEHLAMGAGTNPKNIDQVKDAFQKAIS